MIAPDDQEDARMQAGNRSGKGMATNRQRESEAPATRKTSEREREKDRVEDEGV